MHLNGLRETQLGAAGKNGSVGDSPRGQGKFVQGRWKTGAQQKDTSFALVGYFAPIKI